MAAIRFCDLGRELSSFLHYCRLMDAILPTPRFPISDPKLYDSSRNKPRFRERRNFVIPIRETVA